ncbi:hypothetical protein [Paenibacillus puerhi]|uniref:hypothetical protein n=1 Tax=Paenibacillus puerhi TaxID=2692622 RepID=UPI0013591A81|nr:hypothetical protein [Paenibacillus puerhi]
MPKSALVLLAGVLLVCLLPYSPWITQDVAAAQAARFIASQNTGRTDGCGVVRVIGSRQAFFGREVTLELACGLLPAGSSGPYSRKTFYVSTLGSVHE